MTPEDEEHVRAIAREEIAAAIEAELERARRIFEPRLAAMAALDRIAHEPQK
jgi:hypothetical protein